MMAGYTLLLRSVQESNTKDKYAAAFSEAGEECISLSPIAFEFVDLDVLFSHISHPEDFSGLIFSSPRTVQSVALCLKQCCCADEWESRLQGEWQKLPAFSVGTSTGGEVRKLGLDPVGENSGNAENLCKIILEAINPDSKPMLYPCGTMRRETIPKTLSKEGIKFNADVVYQTVPSASLDQEIAQCLKEKGAPCYIVFFSPSGVQYSKDVLHRHRDKLKNTKLLAIGATTRDAMEAEGYTVTGVAEKPNPSSLLQAIQRCGPDGDG